MPIALPRLGARLRTAVLTTIGALAVGILAAPSPAGAEQVPVARTRPATPGGHSLGVVVEPEPDPTRIECPIPSGSTFVDGWGARRSGGRRHQGVDMIADRGTPIVAVQDGDATFKRSRLGGKAVWLHTPTGNKFYYAHLDRFEGESRAVVAGEVIGYVGSTGNAHGPHLHFETHFGGSAGNPYEATHNACVTEPLGALADAEPAGRRIAAIARAAAPPPVPERLR